MTRAAEAIYWLVMPVVLAVIGILILVSETGCTPRPKLGLAAEQAALSVELAYQAAAIGSLAALRVEGDPAKRRCIAGLDEKAYRAVKVARAAYDRRDASTVEDVKVARLAVSAFLYQTGC